MKKISIVIPCYNEEPNILPMYIAIKEQTAKLPQYEYEYIFADNCSTDASEEILRKIAAEDKRVKVIFNLKNVGADRSGANALYRTTGDAVISIAGDFQDPPELIPEFIKKWGEGNKLVLGQKSKTKNKKAMFLVRKLYYAVIKYLSENDEIEQVTGFGIYDREIVNWFKWIDDPEPFMRNVITSLGYVPVLIPYEQQKRRAGRSSYNFTRYVQTAMVSLIATSRVPLRIVIYLGFITAFFSTIAGFIYLILKLMWWNQFNAGMAPLTIGLFFLGSVQLICLGVVGEYIGAILTRVRKRPLAVEKETINFDEHAGKESHE